AGMGWIEGNPVMVIGQQKGRDTKQKILRNFGMPKPEGYRKALRLMKTAEKFQRPILCLIDTPGAYPGVDAEERGQAEAIARNLLEMAKLEVPVVAVVIGEGGSGGALALGVADRVLMMENAIYSVISPEGCASILWKDSTQASKAAEALKLTAPHLLELGVIDGIVKEPLGGAHADFDAAAAALKEAIVEAFSELSELSAEQLVEERYQKFARMGSVG
ncbi:MAG TPA: acetyl-CoA carboxylase carboxyltransferase subunit alpha, partial [Holophagaceae bacterium]|nr:acetyl-CoA carboxylase carboxyltransferase subunit alpha [Holophagaceae bacterium]